MTERLTYTSGAASSDVHEAFECALEDGRAAAGRPLAHQVGEDELATGPVFERENPARTDEVASLAHEADGEVVRKAVEAARGAQGAWRSLGYEERCAVLRRAVDLASERKLELAATVSLEVGKTRIESIAEVEEVFDLIETHCRQMEEHGGFVVSLGRSAANERNTSVLKPYGVFGVIAPFNFPLALAVNMTAAALVAGNTVVLKPPEEAPRSGAVLGEILREAGLPPGVLNVVHGGSETGRALVDSEVDGIAFTGSVEVGRSIARRLQEGPFPRPVLAEMGGKNPAIVTAAANLDSAAEGVARAAFGFSGQKCSACSRVVVFEDVFDEFVERLRRFTATLAVGDPAEREPFTGPVVNAEAVDRYEQALEEAERDGVLVAGGRLESLPGYYVEPTIVADLPRGHSLTRQELFLPFVTVTRASSLDDALGEANAIPYGLTAGIFTEDAHEAERFLDQIEAGVVYVNRAAGATTGAWPGLQSFAGWKSSGSTGKGGFGPYYLQQFMREQSQTVMA